MLKNYLKTALRNILKYKVYSLINVLGLTIGITSFMFILLWVQDELSYDKFYANSDRIYRIDWASDNPQTRTPHPMSYTMVNDFPEVENAVSLTPLFGPGLSRVTHSVRYLDKVFDEPGFYAADTSFFNVFALEMIKGDKKTALKHPLSVVITDEIADKYFGDDEPIGKTLRFENSFDLTVTGVIRKMPNNSHFHFDFLISYNALRFRETGNWLLWEDFGHYNYVLLRKDVDPENFETKIPGWFLKYNEWPEDYRERLINGTIGFRLKPVTDIHLRSNIRWELETNGNILYVYLFITAGLLILIIACFNFVNLATARSADRAKEVGLRKTVGAVRWQLIGQFLGESVFFGLIAVTLSLILLETILPLFNTLTAKQLDFSIIYDFDLTLGLVLLGILVGVFSGIYPAVFISSFQPLSIIKNTFKSNFKAVVFRKILVVFQFVISIVLIFGTFVIYDQLHFLKTKNLGFNKEQVAVISIKDRSLVRNYESIKNTFLANPGILSVSAVSNVPSRNFNQNPIQWKSDEETVDVSEMRVDYDFFKTLGIKIVEGRDFSQEFSTDLENSFILNEAAARQFDWDTPVNKVITWYDDEITRTGKIIGVAENFHFQSLHQDITPMIFQVFPPDFAFFLVKIKPENITGTMDFLKINYKKFDQANTFEYSFLDYDFKNLYKSEERMGQLFWIFSFLAIFVACLGLYGLISYSAVQKTKEIGVRKVLGASEKNIVTLLSKEYILLVTAANIVAWPTAYFIMRDWLQNFAYRINIGFWSFVVSAFLAMIIAFSTLLIQSLKAASINPVDSIKTE